MAKPTEYLQDAPVIASPFGLNEDDAPSQLGPGEFPVLDYFVEWRKRLCVYYPSALTDFTTGTERMVSSFGFVDASAGGNPNYYSIIFTANRMYQSNNGGAISEVTAAGGSTAITTDAGSNSDYFAITAVNGNVYFAHTGLGPLRKWVPGAVTFSDVAAPGSGYHNGVKYFPRFVGAHINRLLVACDLAPAVGSVYSFDWSVTGSPEDFANFGSGHTTFIDTVDAVTGISVISNRVIIYKSETIVTATPTGDTLAPYFFERPFQGIEQNIGCFNPFSLAGDGVMDFFVSRRGVMAFNGSTLIPVGRGVDNSILFSSGVAFGNQGALITNSVSSRLLNIYALKPTTGNKIYLLNLNTMKWSALSAGAGFGAVRGIGSFFTSSSEKVLVIGSNVASGNSQQVAQMVIATAANSIPTGTRAQLQIPPSLYQNSGANQKTIQRLGVTYTRTSTTTLVATLSVDTELVAGTPRTQNLYASTDFAAAENFTWLDLGVTGRLPFINFQLPAGDGTTSRGWPQIASLAVQFQIGDVQ